MRGHQGPYHARLGIGALGRTLIAYTDVRLRDDVDRSDFEAGLAGVTQVIGAYDYQLELACTDTSDLERAVEVLRRHGARRLHSRIVLRAIALDAGRLLDP